jgi:hypothetical protein
MRNFLKCSALLLLSVSLFAQTSAKKPASKSAPKPAVEATSSALPAGAPTQAVVEEYFKRMFGYDPNLQIRVVSISLSPVPDTGMSPRTRSTPSPGIFSPLVPTLLNTSAESLRSLHSVLPRARMMPSC